LSYKTYKHGEVDAHPVLIRTIESFSQDDDFLGPPFGFQDQPFSFSSALIFSGESLESLKALR
jgi:hypothetical protein